MNFFIAFVLGLILFFIFVFVHFHWERYNYKEKEKANNLINIKNLISDIQGYCLKDNLNDNISSVLFKIKQYDLYIKDGSELQNLLHDLHCCLYNIYYFSKVNPSNETIKIVIIKNQIILPGLICKIKNII